jgi:hypothetical protein
VKDLAREPEPDEPDVQSLVMMNSGAPSNL